MRLTRRGRWAALGSVFLLAVLAGAMLTMADVDERDPTDTEANGQQSSPSADAGEQRVGPGEAEDEARPGEEDPPAEEGAADAGPDVDAIVEERLDALSLEERVGQLIVADPRGDHPTEVSAEAAAENRERFGVATPAEVVEEHALGGVIYFTHAGPDDDPDPDLTNLEAPDQVRDLSAGLQEAAQQGSDVPLLVATDQEHGFITRTDEPFTRLPGAMALGAADDQDLARASGEVAAEELRAAGINVTFAPVADVNTEPANPVIGVRSPGADPEQVAEVTSSTVRGLDAGGVGAVAKHFPGHGSVDVDSHAALPEVSRSEEDLRAIDLVPFEDAIDADVPAIMTGHLAVPALDDQGRPATLSPPMLDGLLRDDLAFDGVIVTDALDMAALQDQGTPVEVALAALEAGADVLLMPPDVPAVRDGLVQAVEDGRLDGDRVDASVRRILTWKAELGVLDAAAEDPASPVSGEDPEEVVGADAHRQTAEEVAAAGATAIEADCEVAPIPDGDALAVVGPDDGGTALLAEELEGRGLQVQAVTTRLAPSDQDIERAVQAASGADAVVQVTTSAWRHDAQARLNERLAAVGPPVHTVATAEPYDAEALQGDTHLAVYDRGAAAHVAAADALLEGSAPGSLPVPVGSHEVGDGGALDPCR